MPIWLLAIFKPSNFTAIFKFILRNWKILLIGLMVFSLWYQNFSSVRFVFGIDTVPALKKDVTKLESQFAVCLDGNKALVASIVKRNEEIDKWKKATAEFEEKIEKLEGDLDDAREDTNTAVDAILNQPTPQTCTEAIDYLRDGVEDLQWNE